MVEPHGFTVVRWVPVSDSFTRSPYETNRPRWDASQPPPMYSDTFGTPMFGEWHTTRASFEETDDANDLEYVGCIDGRPVCSWFPPQEWQEAMDRGAGPSFSLVNGWSGAWNLEHLPNQFGVVRVGAG